MSKVTESVSKQITNVVRGFSLVRGGIMSKVKESVSQELTKEGLPREAFTIG